MAEGGIQAAVGEDDSLQRHYEDTIKGGHMAGKKELVAQMVTDAPSAIRWLIGLGMDFDTQGGDRNGKLVRKKQAAPPRSASCATAISPAWNDESAA